MRILDMFKKKAPLPTYKAPFFIERDRYPATVVLDVWENANKTGQTILLESSDPNISIEINGFQDTGTDYFKDFLSHITEFDNMVQDFCKLNYDSKQLEMKNYLVSLEWITIEADSPIIVMGYWGKYVNIELRAIFEKRKNWELVDIYYQ